jgi:glucose-1-phosphate adenylyltransferase
MTAPIFSRPRFLPASRVEECEIRQSIIAEGSVLKGAHIFHSLVGIRSIIGENVELERTLVMGADYYEDHDDEEYNHQHSIPSMGIGAGSVIHNAIIDKNAHIGKDVRLVNGKNIQQFDGEGYYIRDGIVIVPKKGIVPDGTVI